MKTNATSFNSENCFGEALIIFCKFFLPTTLVSIARATLEQIAYATVKTLNPAVDYNPLESPDFI